MKKMKVNSKMTTDFTGAVLENITIKGIRTSLSMATNKIMHFKVFFKKNVTIVDPGRCSTKYVDFTLNFV